MSTDESRPSRNLTLIIHAALLICLATWIAVIVHHLLRWGSVRRWLLALFAVLLATSAAWLFRNTLKVFHRPAKTRHGILVFVAVSLLLLIIRLALVVAYSVPQTSDYGDYRRLGHDLSTGKGYHFAWSNTGLEAGKSTRPPGYPLLLALAYYVSGQEELAAGVLDALLGTALVVMASLLVFHMSGPVAGLVTLVALGLSPLTLLYTLTSTSETAFGAFLFAGLLFAHYASSMHSNRSLVSCAIGGGLLGYACLIRPPGIVSSLLCLLWLMTTRETPLRRLSRAALFLFALVLSIAPWTYRNYLVHGRLLLISSNGGEVFYSANVVPNKILGGAYMPDNYRTLRRLFPNEVERNTAGFLLGTRYILANPQLFLASLPHRYAMMLETHDWMVGSAWRVPVPKEVLQALSNLFFWFIPLFAIIRSGGIFRLLASSRLSILLAIVYVAWFPLSALFETFPRAQYPYILLPLILSIAAVFRDAPEHRQQSPS
ncbi:MAG: hypothetical protein HPY69_01500 [Armatimonadetes bacterium]|nr:hypothetical protein [Armatimonadota bacterium]